MLANDVHAAQPGPRRAREGLRLLPEQAGDRVLAVRGHARRARRRVARRPRCTLRVRSTYNGKRRRRLRRRPRDALLVLRPRSQHIAKTRAVHRRHDPRQRHGVERRSRARHLVPRRAPDDRDDRERQAGDAVHDGRRSHRDRGVRRRAARACSARSTSASSAGAPMKLVLHNYWRSSASHRVRIALGLKELAYEYVVGQHPASASSTPTAYRAQQPDGAGADARDHRGRRHACTRSPSRCRSSSTSTSASRRRRCCRAIRTCARARAQLAEIVNSGIQPLQNLPTTNAGQGARRRRRRVGRSASSPTGSPRSSARRADDRRHVLRRRRADDRRLLPGAAARVGAPLRRRRRDARRCSLAIEERCIALPAFADAHARPPTRRGEVRTAMAKLESLGIKRLEGIHYYVHDLERVAPVLHDKLDFAETWRSVARARARRAGRSRRASRPATSRSSCCAAGRRGRPRVRASCASTPTASAR